MRLISRPRLLQACCIFALALLASTEPAQEAASAAEAPPEPRFLYSGTIGEKLRVLMELPAPGKEMTGSYFYCRVGDAIDLLGESGADGAIKLVEKTDGKETGRFAGRLLDGGARIEGAWSDPEGKRKLPFALRRAAELLSESRSKQEKLYGYEASASYPRFSLADAKRADTLNAYIKQAVMGRIDGTEADLKEAVKGMTQDEADQFPPATHWEIDVSATDVRYFSEAFVSIAAGEWSYTGGAHGNGGTSGLNLKIGDKIEPVALGSLFKAGSDWLPALSKIVVADLKKQEAADVVNGGIQEFKARELGSFTLSEAGFVFYFDPYAVGPYAQGPFETSVPFKALADVLDEAKIEALIDGAALPSPPKGAK